MHVCVSDPRSLSAFMLCASRSVLSTVHADSTAHTHRDALTCRHLLVPDCLYDQRGMLSTEYDQYIELHNGGLSPQPRPSNTAFELASFPQRGVRLCHKQMS